MATNNAVMQKDRVSDKSPALVNYVHAHGEIEGLLRRKCDPDPFAIRRYVRRRDRWTIWMGGAGRSGMGCEWLVWEGLGRTRIRTRTRTPGKGRHDVALQPCTMKVVSQASPS